MRIWPVWLYRVSGESMAPTYRPGETLLGWRWFRPRVGQVVVAVVGGRPLIKRIIRLEGSNMWLEGDNSSASTDSRTFGFVETSRLQAKIMRSLG